MTAALLSTAALASLAAWLIPLAIHIARRTESRTVVFAALRWLHPKPAPRRRLRIDERRLLAVRLLMLGALALWLARPVLWGAEDARPVVAITPGLQPPAAGSDARRVWLAPGFPRIEDPSPAPPRNPISLIRQLDAELSPETPLEVVVPATLDGVDAERPRLSRRVAWRVASQEPARAPAPAPTPRLIVRHAPGAEDAVRYFRATAAAWSRPGDPPAFEAAAVDRPLPPDAVRLVWLAPGPPSEAATAWIRRGGTALLAREARLPLDGELETVWSGADGEPLAVAGRLGRGRVIQLTRPLQPSSLPQLVEPDFPDVLLRLLAPPPAPTRVLAAEHAPLTGATAYPQPPLDLRPWLALFIAAVFALERWMATRRARGAAP